MHVSQLMMSLPKLRATSHYKSDFLLFSHIVSHYNGVCDCGLNNLHEQLGMPVANLRYSLLRLQAARLIRYLGSAHVGSRNMVRKLYGVEQDFVDDVSRETPEL